MPLQISSYVDPGVYIGEVVVPGAVNIATTPALACIIGVGDRSKAVTNETVQRGLVRGEALTLVNLSGAATGVSAPVGSIQTLTGGAGAFTNARAGCQIRITAAVNLTNNGTFEILDVPSATTVRYINAAGVVEASPVTYAITPFVALANRSDRKLQDTTLYRNAIAQSDNYIAYQRAYVLGTVASATFDLTIATNTNTFCLEMDGQTAITIRLLYNAAPSIAIVGREIRVNQTFSGALGAAATRAEIVTAINSALNAATALGFGPAYASACVDATTGFQISSQLLTSAGDVRIFAPISSSGLNLLFGASASGNRNAISYLRASALIYSSTAAFTADYVNLDSQSDTLLQTPVLSVTRVGSEAGIGTYVQDTDFLLSGNAIAWGGSGAPPDTAATYTTPTAGTYNVSVNTTLTLGFDGKANIDVVLTGLATPPLGYANPGAPAAATAAELAANINAVFGNNVAYGPRYNSVASVTTVGASTYLTLTSPNDGQAYAVTIAAPAALSATLAVLGLQTTQLPYTVVGAGKRPTLASFYFASYTITRPSTDYNVQKRFFNLDAARADLGDTASTNPIMIACELAFANLAPSVVVVQVDDTTLAGSPTRAEFLAAMNVTLKADVVTDVIALSTSLDVQTDLKDHIETACAPSRKRYRRGWFGMARSTPIGDKDTSGSYVYRATRTLQYAPDSPARGRAFLVAPPQLTGVSRDIVISDGSTQTVNLDSTYLAVALAAKKSSFTSPAASLASRTITGFNISDVTDTNIWDPAQRGLLAGQGCMVVTYDAGNFVVLDPVSTEAGGGGLAAFTYDNTSSQKDNVTRKIDAALKANVIGIVPTDLSDFIADIKLIIRGVISGEIGAFAIGPYRNSNGTTRAIDMTTDIIVDQDPNDPTKFFFAYWYNLRYPALRLFGQFSVDNPWFSPPSG